MKKYFFIITLLFKTCFFSYASAESTDEFLARQQLKKPLPIEGLQPYGLPNFCKDTNCTVSLGLYKRIYKFTPSKETKKYSLKEELGFSEKMLVRRADSIFSSQSTLALLMVDDGKIIYEKYKPGTDANTPFQGQSLSKGVASMAVGAALCAGYINNLDDQAKKYNEALDGTKEGEATLAQLMSMSSGGLRGFSPFGGFPENGWDIGSFYNPAYKNIELMIKKYSGSQIKSDGTMVKAGEEFSYKSFDPLAISLVLEGAEPGRFKKIFQEELIDRVGFEGNVYWVHDEKGYPHLANAFIANLRDWGRFADFVMQSINSKENNCMDNYVKDATKTHIKNRTNMWGSNFTFHEMMGGYGYYFWTDKKNSRNGGVHLVGGFGQMLSINPSKRKYIVMISSKDNNEFMSFYDLYEVF